MRYGYCKNCFWWKWGYCFMQNKETRKNYIAQTSTAEGHRMKN